MAALYDRIGKTYAASRTREPRIAALVNSALGDARSVVNVGAGTGSYEPNDREVLAVEPSETMIAQRPAGAARVVRACAEDLPFADGTFDAALAVNTVHHWTDVRAGIRQLCRVARKRVVIFLRDPGSGTSFWLTEDYLPSLDASERMAAILAAVVDELPRLRSVPFPLPRDCVDGVFTAYWGRPEMYLDGELRRNISNFCLSEGGVAEGLARLRDDLETGAWDRKYGHLRSLPALDLGHRLLVAELADATQS